MIKQRSGRPADRGTVAAVHAVIVLLLLAGCGSSGQAPPVWHERASDPALNDDLRKPLPQTADGTPVLSEEQAMPAQQAADAGAQTSADASSAASYALLDQSTAADAAGNRTAAIGYVERALRLSPRDPILWIRLGRLQLPDAPLPAQRYARKALALTTPDTPSYRNAWLLIADAKELDGDRASAEAIRDRFRTLTG